MNKPFLFISILFTLLLPTSCKKKEIDPVEPIQQFVSDFDGNKYTVIRIGKQYWTKENIRTTQYADGSVIPNIYNNDEWESLTTDAWCYYDNNSANDSKYGKLYNWYVVTDPRNICPCGWHVPSDAEWKTLTDFLGGESVAGGKMKTSSNWFDFDGQSSTNGTNESGFSGLPGGFRGDVFADFHGSGSVGTWWSTTESATTHAWYRMLFYEYGTIDNFYIPKKAGVSVRCIKD